MSSAESTSARNAPKLPYVNGSGEVFAMVTSRLITQPDGSVKSTHPMMPRIAKYLEHIESMETPSNITRTTLAEKPTPLHRRPSLKRKGGNAPVDYTVAEQMADLRAAYEAGDVREAIILYAQLSRHLPY